MKETILELMSAFNKYTPSKRIKSIKRLHKYLFGYSVFGVGCLILGLTVFPFIFLTTPNLDIRHRRARTVIHHAFRIFLNFAEFLNILHIKTTNLEALDSLEGKIIISNHPSLLDVVVTMSRVKNLQCIVKAKLWKNMFVGSIVRTAGYIRNDMDPVDLLESCQKQLDRGQNILLFPEGTRSTPGQPIKLHRSLGNLALAANVDIQILCLKCRPVSLTKQQKWYEVPETTMELELTPGILLSIKDFAPDTPRSLRVRALTREIETYYNRYLGYA